MVAGLAQVLADGDEVAQAFRVLRVFRMDLLIQFQRALIVAHASITTRDHQPPLDFLRLDLGGSFEEMDRLLVHLRLDVPDA